MNSQRDQVPLKALSNSYDSGHLTERISERPWHGLLVAMQTGAESQNQTAARLNYVERGTKSRGLP